MHFTSTVHRWEKFVAFMEQFNLASLDKPETINYDVALTFLMYVGEGGREKHVFHVFSCDGIDSCNCPKFSSVNTLISYRSALRQMFTVNFPTTINPFNSIQVDCLILALQHKFLDNRIPTKQAKALSEGVILETLKQAEFDAIFERDKSKQWTLLRNILVCKVMAAFGCRASDVLRLKCSDITESVDALVFSFYNTKTAMTNGPRVEIVYKVNDTFKVISSMSEWKPLAHAIFPFCLKKHLDLANPPHMKSAVINRFVKLLFGDEFSSHSLRVSKACDLALKDDNFDDIALKMGMKSPVTAKRYSQQRLKVSNDCQRKLVYGPAPV